MESVLWFQPTLLMMNRLNGKSAGWEAHLLKTCVEFSFFIYDNSEHICGNHVFFTICLLN